MRCPLVVSVLFVSVSTGIRWCIGPDRCGDDLFGAPPLSVVEEPKDDAFRPCCRSCETVEACTNSRSEEILFVKYLLPHIKEEKQFVELGGNDGIHASNTLYLEHCLGWRGVLIEAHPVHYQRMIANRPRITSIHAAACEKNGFVNFTKRPLPSSKIVAAGDHIDVPCVALKDVFDALRIHTIAFFSLDVEGAEIRVLHGIDFSKVRIAALVMEELVKTPSSQRADARRILETNANLRLAFTHCWRPRACDSYWYNPVLLPTFDHRFVVANNNNNFSDYPQLPMSDHPMHHDSLCRSPHALSIGSE